MNQNMIISEKIFCQGSQKAQAILCVLTSIFGCYGGKSAAENRVWILSVIAYFSFIFAKMSARFSSSVRPLRLPAQEK